ncbi:MAG: type II secretion system major pseudopilin GspG [Planctomycetia bacterium]|nr:type II secretion system major pseudopilin GspG [Planctomycetia bacterium]
MALWYYQDSSGRGVGPFTEEQFRAGVSTGAINPATLVRREDDPQSYPAGTIPGLFTPTSGDPRFPGGIPMVTPSTKSGITPIGIVLIVVLGGIVPLVLVALAVVAGPQLMGTREDAKIRQARAQVKTFMSTLDMYQVEANEYPTTDQGLRALLEQPEGYPEIASWSKLLKSEKDLVDPWGNDYQYELDEGTDEPRIWSYGPDGKDGTEDDINSWDGYVSEYE